MFPGLVALALSWQQLQANFSVTFKSSTNEVGIKPDNTIRVLSWNVARWDEANRDIRGGESFQNVMMDWLRGIDADIVCLQEFFECFDPNFSVQNIPAIKEMGYPYHYFFPSSKIFDGNFQFGLCIFSRYPMLDSARFINQGTSHSEGFSYVDLQIRAKAIRVFNTHLESFGFRKEDFNWSKNTMSISDMARRFKKSYEMRNFQARILRSYIDESPYPTIVCGDIDDVPSSYTYFKVKGNFTDAFLKKGTGMGRTYNLYFPSLRIDYIFVDKRLDIRNYIRPKFAYSDHFPLIVDFVVNE